MSALGMYRAIQQEKAMQTKTAQARCRSYPVPYGDRLLVRRSEAAEMSDGGIYLPDKAKPQPTEGTVLGVGKGHITESGVIIASGIERGQTVVFPRYAGIEIDHDGETLLILNATDVLAVR